MDVTFTEIQTVLTRTSGYLKTVTSHSLQPYRGCPLGRSLCGAGCYVQHNRWLTRGQAWGEFLEVRRNAAEAYRGGYARERRWARRNGGDFGIFFSSSTEPFPPQERRHGVSRRVLEAMIDQPPDLLILQTHSHRVTAYLDLYRRLIERCRLRVHVSIETDRDRLPGLPPHASPVERRFEAAREIHSAGIPTVITVSPLLPMSDPHDFFRRARRSAGAVVIDHFIEGDGTRDGRRTLRTALPEAMAAAVPESVELGYRDRIVAIAREYFPGRVGVSIDGFAGRYASAGPDSAQAGIKRASAL